MSSPGKFRQIEYRFKEGDRVQWGEMKGFYPAGEGVVLDGYMRSEWSSRPMYVIRLDEKDGGEFVRRSEMMLELVSALEPSSVM